MNSCTPDKNSRADSGRRAAILFVDDDAAHRLIARRALGGALPGLDMLEAAHCREAAAIIRAQAERLVLAIIDLKLDHERGVDIVAALRADAALSGLPIIIVSTSDLPGHIAECYACGADCYVIKHVDPAVYVNDLVHAVRYYLRLK